MTHIEVIISDNTFKFKKYKIKIKTKLKVQQNNKYKQP